MPQNLSADVFDRAGPLSVVGLLQRAVNLVCTGWYRQAASYVQQTLVSLKRGSQLALLQRLREASSRTTW